MKRGYSFLSILFFFAILHVHAQNYQISSPDDDAEESAGYTTVTLNSPVIDLTADPTNPRNMKQIVGLRFTNVQLQKGEALSNCYLAFHVDQACNKISMLSITGEKSENAQPFQTINRNLSSRTRTIAKINWNNVEAWNETGAIMRSPDLSNVLMEIIKHENWRPGNSIVLLIEGNGQRHATAFDKNPELAVQLILNDASGTRYKRPAVVQTPSVSPSPSQPQATVQTDECNIPEPPVGVAKQAYLQGNAYMENKDFKSAESRYSMAIDNLKHPKFYIARAAARQLLDRFSEAQNDLNQAVALGIDERMAQKCFQDLVQLNKNFSTASGTFEACFTKNVRNLPLPPCPIYIDLRNGKATLSMDPQREVSEKKNGDYKGKPYNTVVLTVNWVIIPGEFHECNPNVDTSIKPRNVNMTIPAKTSGWFEIPVEMSLTNTYLYGDQVIAKQVTEKNNHYLIGYLYKSHTGQTVLTGGFYNAQGGSAPLQIGTE